MQIGNAIKRLRDIKNISQKDLAVKAKMTQTQLSLIEVGKSNGSIKTITKLCNCLDTPVSIVLWMATEESDIQENKRESFKMIKPSIDALILALHE
jgi:transcriptional regulator with XRE-family HTH domain